MDIRTQQAIIHGVTKSWTQLSMHTPFLLRDNKVRNNLCHYCYRIKLGPSIHVPTHTHTHTHTHNLLILDCSKEKVQNLLQGTQCEAEKGKWSAHAQNI